MCVVYNVPDVTSHGCGDIHSQLCLNTTRMNLAQETRFWYNVNYTLTCPNGSNTGPWECINMDPYHTSLITRMRNSSSNDTSMISKILNVTWYVEPGEWSMQRQREWICVWVWVWVRCDIISLRLYVKMCEKDSGEEKEKIDNRGKDDNNTYVPCLLGSQ